MPTNTEKAINFAASMIRKGEYPGNAINIAAGYYKVGRAEVQSGLSARAGKTRKGKTISKPKVQCYSCGQRESKWKLNRRDGYAPVHSEYLCDQCFQNPNIREGFHSHQQGVTHKWVKYVSNC